MCQCRVARFSWGGWLQLPHEFDAILAKEDKAVAQVVLSDEYQRAAKTEGIVGMAAGILVVAAIFLMVTKPGL